MSSIKKNIRFFLIFGIIIMIIVSICLKVFGAKEAISPESFYRIMINYNYDIIDKGVIKNTGEQYKSKINSIPTATQPMDVFSAVNVRKTTEFVYMIFDKPKDAADYYTKYINSTRLDVSKQDSFMNYLSSGSKGIQEDSTRSGSGMNYSRYYAMKFGDSYLLLSRIDNTVMAASIDIEDQREGDRVLDDLGY